MNSQSLVGKEIKTTLGNTSILSSKFISLKTNMSDMSIIKIVEIKTSLGVFQMDMNDVIKSLKVDA